MGVSVYFLLHHSQGRVVAALSFFVELGVICRVRCGGSDPYY